MDQGNNSLKKKKESRKKQSLVQFGERGTETDFRETAVSDPEEVFQFPTK